MTVAFTARVRRGKIQIAEQDAFTSHLARLEGRAVEVIVQEPGERRTLPQNAFYHVVVHLISEETGYTEREAHALLKALYLPIGVESTAKLTRRQFSAYLEYVLMWAEGWLGIRIPPRDKIVTEVA